MTTNSQKVYKVYDEELEEILGKQQLIDFANYRLIVDVDLFKDMMESVEDEELLKVLKSGQKVNSLELAFEIIKLSGFHIKEINVY